jgi:hypothetical protein
MRRATLAALVALAACRCPEPAAPRVIFTSAPCLAEEDAPPAPPGRDAVAGSEQGCTSPSGCLTPELYVWVAAVRAWARDAWTRCGPPAAQPPADNGGEP